MLKRWQFWVGLLISAVFLYIALRGLKLGEVWEIDADRPIPVAHPRRGGLLCGRVGALLALALHAAPAQKDPHRAPCSPSSAIGYMGNNIYPARAGEVLRAVILKQREGVPVSASLATVIVERIFDGVVMLAFVFVNLPELARLTHDSGIIGNVDIRTVAIIGTVAFIGALLVFLLAAMFPRTTERLLDVFLQHRARALSRQNARHCPAFPHRPRSRCARPPKR